MSNRRQPGFGPSGLPPAIEGSRPLAGTFLRGGEPDPHGVQVSCRVSRETWCPCGSDTPGMPFSDFPVCNLSAPQKSEEFRGTSHGLPRSSRASPNAGSTFDHASAASSQPSWAFVTLQRLKLRRPFHDGVAKSRQNPLTAFLRSQRIDPKAAFEARQVSFALATLLSFLRLYSRLP